jgi:hypothetical protein
VGPRPGGFPGWVTALLEKPPRLDLFDLTVRQAMTG